MFIEKYSFIYFSVHLLSVVGFIVLALLVVCFIDDMAKKIKGYFDHKAKLEEMTELFDLVCDEIGNYAVSSGTKDRVLKAKVRSLDIGIRYEEDEEEY